MRPTMTVSVSRTGSPSIKSGTTGLIGLWRWVRARVSVIAEKPRSWLPASPMKTVAGKVL